MMGSLADDMEARAKQRVLIVDDDESLLMLCSQTLASAGYDTASAPDGVDALAIMAQFKPDFITLDLMMPRMNGHQFCGKLAERGIRIPIIIVSAYWEPANEGVLRQDSNVVGFIKKPIRYAKLAATIQRILWSAGDFVPQLP
ncbi:MAG TPA: hypothetical protein DCZ01_06415 [Elusimicrobia bacterium]|nr:MAG: hypothetical protein A2X37_00350 [Elusimicrobia bacterium GWA2_66_18]OGR69346.1 MAG: hypothetical protein A2X40_02910 [Elusimicrobia bacterium GWC2_65_9]HAZ08144.1 hypothetical protein [Elusimicrobiota bacterium]